MRNIHFLLFFVFLISFVSAETNIGSDITYGKVIWEEETTTTSTSNTSNINSSEYWDNMDTINTTQMEDNNGVLNILESWITGLFGAISSKKGDGKYLYNDSTTIYFNETKLNITIADYTSNISASGGNSSWNQSYADGLYVDVTGDNMTGNLSNTEWFNGKFNWTVGDGYSTFDGNTLLFNQSKFEITYYNATQSSLIAGTIEGTIVKTQHQDANYDDDTLNITESAGSPGLDIIINFTGISNFTQGVMRYYTSSLSGSSPIIQLWDYTNNEWESYPKVTESLTYSFIEQPVFDDERHVEDGVVRMRIYKESNGNINNKYYIDWIAIAQGFGVPSGTETDPFFTDWKNTPVLNNNLNMTDKNVSTSGWFKGLFNWTSIISWINFDGATLSLDDGLFNSTINEIGVRAGFNQTYNETYAGLINNASYLSTYNETYAGLINNASYLSTYNETYAGLINNASYLSTYNETYDSTTLEWNGNKTYVYNHTSDTFNLYNSTWDNRQFVLDTNSSMASYVLYVNGTMKSYVDSQAGGSSSLWGSNGSNIYNTTAFVGIGTEEPESILQIGDQDYDTDLALTLSTYGTASYNKYINFDSDGSTRWFLNSNSNDNFIISATGDSIDRDFYLKYNDGGTMRDAFFLDSSGGAMYMDDTRLEFTGTAGGAGTASIILETDTYGTILCKKTPYCTYQANGHLRFFPGSSSGMVVGTDTTPDFKLEIYEPVNKGYFGITQNNTASDGNIFIVNKSGYIGIHNSNPEEYLHIGEGSISDLSGTRITLAEDSGIVGINVGWNDTNRGFLGWISSWNETGDLLLATGGIGNIIIGSNSEKVGMGGVTSPSAILDVGGDIVSHNLTISDGYITGANGEYMKIGSTNDFFDFRIGDENLYITDIGTDLTFNSDTGNILFVDNVQISDGSISCSQTGAGDLCVDNDLEVDATIRQGGCPVGFTRTGLGCIQTAEEGTGTAEEGSDDCYDTYGGRLPTAEEIYISFLNFALTDEADDYEWVADRDTYNYYCVLVQSDITSGKSNIAVEGCTNDYDYRCFIPFGGGS